MNNKVISQDEEGSRLDRILHKNYPYLNQSRIEKSLRKKLISVNNQKVTSNYRVIAGDQIFISSHLIEQITKPDKNIYSNQVELIRDNILFQNENFIVLNKPTGLAVQGGSKIKVSIDDIMPEYIDSLEYWFEEKPTHKLVHRLDKETSGILIIALSNKTAQQLALAFKEKTTQKTYYAILNGRLEKNHGIISTIIDKEKKGIKEENSQTKYRVIAKNAQASFVEFQPITGKNHQLRLHSLELGFPILGDDKYDPLIQNNKNNKLHLHAGKIIFPFNNETLKFEAELPAYFKETLNKLKLL